MDISYLKKIEKRLAERTVVDSFFRGSKYYEHLINIRGYSKENVENESNFWIQRGDYDRNLPSLKVWGFRHVPSFDEVQQSIRYIAMEYIHKQWMYRRLKKC